MTNKKLLQTVVLIALLFPLAVCGQSAYHGQVEQCRSSNLYEQYQCRLQMYMKQYPQSQLRDVYKFCFQDFWGLEHLLSDSMGAVRYINYELEHSDSADWQRPLFCYPLPQNNYVRVDINYVRQGIIPMGVLVSAMLQSAQDETCDIDLWRSRWISILQMLKQIEPQPQNYDEDLAEITELLDSGRYACHHSRLFNATYRQHYRIVRRDIFEKQLLPLIEAKQ